MQQTDKLIRSLELLSERYDQLLARAAIAVRNLEQFLDEHDFGLSATLVADNGETGDRAKMLSCERYDGRYRIVARFPKCRNPEANLPDRPKVGTGKWPEDWRIMPWHDCSRNAKLETARLLPALLERLRERVHSTLEAVEGAISPFETIYAPVGVPAAYDPNAVAF